MRCDLAGKVSLVTGAARGIGQAIADRLAANGSRVVYTDLEPEAAAAAASRAAGARGLRVDVTRADEIEAVIGQVVAELGRRDDFHVREDSHWHRRGHGGGPAGAGAA